MLVKQCRSTLIGKVYFFRNTLHVFNLTVFWITPARCKGLFFAGWIACIYPLSLIKCTLRVSLGSASEQLIHFTKVQPIAILCHLVKCSNISDESVTKLPVFKNFWLTVRFGISMKGKTDSRFLLVTNDPFKL